jgi:hypothetical protein
MQPVLPLLFVLAAAAGGAPEDSPIRTEAIRAHMRFLADDLLEGRGTGSRGYDLAAAYVAAQLEAHGIAPGAGGSYFQKVPMRRGVRVPEGSELTLIRDGREERLTNEKDFLAAVDFVRESSVVKAPVVFVGYGVTAPEQGHDDYAGVDVKGKIILRLSGAPASFPRTLRAHHSSTYVKAQNAVAHGAVGTLDLRTPTDARRGPWERTLRQARLPGFKWVDEKGAPADAFPELLASASLSIEGGQKLLQGTTWTLETIASTAEKGQPFSFALPGEVRLQTVTRHSAAESANVVGVLKGTDPGLAAEHIVYSAHLDHLGALPAAPDGASGDLIHNGAFDNATGIASLIEIARAFKQARPAPRRSIVFLAVTGEEKGLLGSNYFAAHPTVPELVANLNMDMIMALYPPKDVVLLGAEHSSLGPVATRAARKLGLEVTADPIPEQVRFVRSDQYSFVKRGVPALNVNHGPQSTDPARKGPEIAARWLREIYHTPKDDLTQTIDYDTLARLARLNFIIGHEVAGAAARPSWNEGDFFGRTFGRARGKSAAP